MKPPEKPTYTCRYCRRVGTDEIFNTTRWGNRTGVCSNCAEQIPERTKPLTDKEIYDNKVDESYADKHH